MAEPSTQNLTYLDNPYGEPKREFSFLEHFEKLAEQSIGLINDLKLEPLCQNTPPSTQVLSQFSQLGRERQVQILSDLREFCELVRSLPGPQETRRETHRKPRVSSKLMFFLDS